MPEFLLHNGLPALFVISFLAATILPLGSEWLLVALILQAHDVENVVAVATLGNYLGACTTYAIGVWGSTFIMEKILRINQNQVERATRLYQKYGSWSILLSWVPVIGDPLCLVGGSLRLNFIHFSLLAFSGKLARYALIASVTVSSMA
ncbi:MAG: DedA family protein [Proteobacteria bacterium]|nr:DedA family protein [Pseudomonadota bacterium]MBU1640501.1 DedA family protein [Pseudomonadota bacterium]